ncbi:mannitol dehydrogenase family protein [Mycetocola spongiae]|uniref:mannitol dehydrogenase family protein n=1 Tax=Mycetocola spongiae TaxID=2859226 RepID=UPI001CF533C6|nr:mannitol dehydrogenase family protein [Mycetocola spongiae]
MSLPLSQLHGHRPAGDIPVAVPAYDRSALGVGIIHFGLGNFHRAHEAMYLDRLLAAGEDPGWGICGVGVMPGDARMRDVLAAQDNLYTLVLKAGDGGLEARVIGSIARFLYAPDDPEAVLRALAAPGTRIVSLTVTEGGYRLPEAADSAGVFALIIAGLARRRAAGIAPFTVLSCDNVPGNGDVARSVVLDCARRSDPALAEWIAAEVAFPNSMVDRITPVTTDADRALVAERLGLEDAWPVVAEPFVQWVVEDHFPAGRPAWERAGVQLVEDVEPYELMKLRLLNAAHQGMAYTGLLRGFTFAHEAAADPVIAGFLHRYLAEARASLEAVPGINLDDYIRQLFIRFTNPAIADTLDRLATDAVNRIPKFVLPAVRDNLAAGRPAGAGALLVAAWAEWVARSPEPGDPLEHEVWTRARNLGEDPLAFLRCEQVFGELANNAIFSEGYIASLEAIRAHGIDAALEGSPE